MKVSELFEAPHRELHVIDRPKVVPKEVPIDKPGGWNVMILNNPVTPYQVVIEALMACVGLSENEAGKRMLKAHRNGWCAVAAYGSKDLAETVASNIEKHAFSNNRYDELKPHANHRGPWPLDTEVLEAGDQA